MRLNRKGYMLVEIIVSSVLAMTIAYYLLNLTYKFKNTAEDIYQNYYYTQDNLLITKNIMSDLDKGNIRNISRTSYTAVIDSQTKILKEEFDFELYEDYTNRSKRRLTIDIENGKVLYGKINDDGNYDKYDISYYEKKLEDSLIIKSVTMNESHQTITFNIEIKSFYTGKDYSIKLFGIKKILKPE